MRIAFVTSEFVTEANYDGGLSNYLGRVCRALQSAGHEVVVIVRSDRDEQIDFHGVEVHRVVPRWDAKMRVDRVDRLCPRSLYMPYQDVKAAWAVWLCWRRLQKAKPFDVIQLTNVMSIGLFFRRQRRVPMCMRLSSFHPGWSDRRGEVVPRAARWRDRMEKVALRRFRFAYAPTEHVAAKAQAYYSMKDVRVLETPFFRETPSEDEGRETSRPSGPYVLYFGAKKSVKGMVELAGALPAFLRACPEWSVVCIGKDGKGPDGGSMEGYLRTASGEAVDRLALLPPLDHSSLYPWIQSAGFVLVPSVADNMPNAALEALGLGRPVLASNTTGLDRFVVAGETGWVVPSKNVEALAEGLIEAALTPESVRDAMGQRGVERMASLLPEKAIPRLVAYYETIREQW